MIRRTTDTKQPSVSPLVAIVCAIGQGARCCRFLVADGAGFHCAKLDPMLSSKIDKRHVTHAMVARGDNCPGKPFGAVL